MPLPPPPPLPQLLLPPLTTNATPATPAALAAPAAPLPPPQQLIHGWSTPTAPCACQQQHTQLVKELEVDITVYKGKDSATMLYHCGKSIYGHGKLSAELDIMIDAQLEVLGYSKWWLDGKTGSNKLYWQQCMCCIVKPKGADSSKNILSAKLIEHDGEAVTVSPADKYVCLLSNPAWVSGIKSKGM